MRALSAVFGSALWAVAGAVSPVEIGRFQQTASEARLASDTPLQENERFALHAYLESASDQDHTVQAASRFAVSAALSASSLVCYNDTIFRDGFDGTGL